MLLYVDIMGTNLRIYFKQQQESSIENMLLKEVSI